MGAGTSSANIFGGEDTSGCNASSLTQGEDIAGGILHGALNMFGLGFLSDPVGPLQDALSDANSKLQSIYNQNGLAFAKEQVEVTKLLQEVMETHDNTIQEMMSINTEITNQHLGKVDITLVSIGVLVLILCMYLLINPRIGSKFGSK